MSWDIYGHELRRGYCEVHPMTALTIPPADWTSAVLLWSAVAVAFGCLLFKAFTRKDVHDE